MSKYKCVFCNTDFSSKANLNYHKTNTKYCLEKQGIKHEFNCEECKKLFLSDNMLQKHYLKCIDYQKQQMKIHYEKIISEKDKHIKELESKLENIALKAVSRPTNIVNTTNTDNRIQQTINNLIPITDDHLREQAQFLTLDHIKQGALGYANFACDYALKDRITCVDVSRRKVKYKNQDGIVITDPEMSVLSKKLFCSIKDKNTELTRLYKQELREMVLQKFRDSGDDMTDEKTMDLDMAIEQINKHMENASNLDYQVTKIVEGEKPNIYHEFIKEVCNKTVG
jgi:hypothetical protein